jgi:hypothetical protein
MTRSLSEVFCSWPPMMINVPRSVLDMLPVPFIWVASAGR